MRRHSQAYQYNSVEQYLWLREYSSKHQRRYFTNQALDKIKYRTQTSENDTFILLIDDFCLIRHSIFKYSLLPKTFRDIPTLLFHFVSKHVSILISYRLPHAGGFISTIIMRSIIPKHGNGRELIVLYILERRPYL